MVATGRRLGSQSLQKLLYHARLNIGVLKIVVACGMRDWDGALVSQQLFDLQWQRAGDCGEVGGPDGTVAG